MNVLLILHPSWYYSFSAVFFCSIDIEDDVGSQIVLHIESLSQALHAFINGKLARKMKLKTTTSDDNVFISLHRKIFLDLSNNTYM